jgi:hypothetical protein
MTPGELLKRNAFITKKVEACGVYYFSFKVLYKGLYKHNVYTKV